MSNNTISGGSPAVDSEALGEWVAETAAQKGISERELLDEILSSYWVLEELSDVIVDSDAESPAANAQPERSQPKAQRETVGGPSTTHTEPEAEQSTDPKAPNQPEPQTDDHPQNTETEQPVEADAAAGGDANDDIAISRTFHYRAAADDAEKSDEEIEISGIEQELQKLRTVVTELSGDESLPNPESGADSERAETSHPPNRELKTDGNDSHIDDSHGASDPLAAHSGAIDELDDELVEIRNQLSELEAELTRKVEANAESQEELEAWIEDEFDNIEDVLQHLLSTTDNLEYRVGSAVESQREQLEPLQAAHAEQEQLTTLKEEAIQKDVETAECEDCEEDVDLGVLPSPYCPNCEQRFTGVEGGSAWNPFSSATLRTTPSRRQSAAAPPADSHGATEAHEQRGPQSNQSPETPEQQPQPGDPNGDRPDGDSWG
ncbi:hypothetical protein EGH24_00105 [Halonotius terrestris]|uniref:Uncharacterized protein n=1 Tax=Halonotius terrestris TaxID=2487750 RepID=A0A8J8TD79_9EURY|nr:hypothetical protein [Halonotius terrestris]TQQ83246.1 hypothetical protein EGH24_00105 [Halonotius terrestris]